VQEILGHSNINTTQAYTAVTLNNLEEAIKSLNTTSDVKKTRTSPTAEENTSITRQGNYEETEHKKKIRLLARALAGQICPPSLWDPETLRALPVDFRPGRYSLPFGVVEILKDKHIRG
jgi:hypothetical protein